SVVAAPITTSARGLTSVCPRGAFASIPRGTTCPTSTKVSAWTSPSRSSGTSSVPPASATDPLPSAAAAASADSGRSSSNSLLGALPQFRLAERVQHLFAGDGQRAYVGARGVADRVRDCGCGRNDRRLAEALRAEVRQVLIGLVDQFRHDLWDVGDRGSLYASSVRVSTFPVCGS